MCFDKPSGSSILCDRYRYLSASYIKMSHIFANGNRVSLPNKSSKSKSVRTTTQIGKLPAPRLKGISRLELECMWHGLHQNDLGAPNRQSGSDCRIRQKMCRVWGLTMPLENSVGLYYKPYITFVEQELTRSAKIVQGMTLQELMHELGKGNYVIAGVSPQIRYPDSKPKTKSGHLVLMVGYGKTKQEFYLHNPSGTSKETQEYAVVKFSDFKRFFSGRGIVIQGGSIS